jgi:hypothetical protein
LTGSHDLSIIPYMGNRVVRSLVLLCGLTLAFPPGWCCMIPLPAAQAEESETDDGPAASSAPCCCCKKKEPVPASAPAQPVQDAPRPCPTGKCPWLERDTTAPSHPEQFHPDYSVVAVIPMVDAAHTPAVEPEEVSLRALPASPPIHVIDCVWLC